MSLTHVSEACLLALEALHVGGLVIYPTETLYALGCLATHHKAVHAVVAAKGRPVTKPLPLIVGSWEMVDRFLCLDHFTAELVRAFWPASLSVITRVRDDISPLAKDAQGRAAVRMSPHPIARKLCEAAGAPLISSSANRSGQDPCSRPDELDSELLRLSKAVVVDAKPWPAGGLPSTLVEVIDRRTVRILRHGSVRADEILGKDFRIL